MQTTINMPITLIIFIIGSIIGLIGAILGIVGYFVKNIHLDMKTVIENLAKAVHGLEIITTNMETKGNHIKERVEDLEGRVDVGIISRQIFEKDYGYVLDWLKSHVNKLEELINKKN